MSPVPSVAIAGDSGLAAVQQYVQVKQAQLDKDDASAETLAKRSPATKISNSINSDASTSIFNDIANGPLAQLGSDFVAEQVAMNGAAILNNVDKAILPITAPLEKAYGVVFDTIASALVAKNDTVMYFLQILAGNIIAEIDKKRAMLLVMEAKLTLLYNALVTLVAANPFFSKYLLQLRQALLHIVSARGQVAQVSGTLQSKNIWLKTQFNNALSELTIAEGLMQPAGKKPDHAITSTGFLAGVGLPSVPQQLTALLTVPQLVKELVSASDGYFIQTLKVNALIVSFVTGYLNLQASGSQKLQSYSLSTLANLLSQIDALIASMATRLNGDPSAIATPLSGFQPDGVKTSAAALQWLMQIKVILHYSALVPGNALQTLTVSNTILDHYNKAVAGIKTKNVRAESGAVLQATQGSEDVTDLEGQLSTFAFASLQAIVSGKAAANVLSLGRVLKVRMDLSVAQDQEIESLLKVFTATKANLPTGVAAIGAGIFTMLDAFGMDRASSLLNTGNFTDFFNLTAKSVTNVGAALLGIGALKACLNTEEDRAQLSAAELLLQREQKAKELLAQRGASTSLQQQVVANQNQKIQLSNVLAQANKANSKCHPNQSLASSLINKISSAVGAVVPTNMGTGIV